MILLITRNIPISISQYRKLQALKDKIGQETALSIREGLDMVLEKYASPLTPDGEKKQADEVQAF